jgi:hypothetical protein
VPTDSVTAGHESRSLPTVTGNVPGPAASAGPGPAARQLGKDSADEHWHPGPAGLAQSQVPTRSPHMFKLEPVHWQHILEARLYPCCLEPPLPV